MKKFVTFLCILMMVFSIVGCSSTSETVTEVTEEEETEEYAEFDWPDSDIAKLLPVPKSNIGKIGWEASYGFVLYVAETTQDDFKEYVDQCKSNGFTVDYQSGDDYFISNNEDGYHINLQWDEGDVMFIRIDEPDEEVEESSADTNIETEQSAAERISDDAEIDPEFKATMDSYEAFFDEYCEFMEKYNSSSDTSSMLTDYAEYMEKYTDCMTKISDIDEESLNAAELEYYTEVNLRITQKLAAIAQ